MFGVPNAKFLAFGTPHTSDVIKKYFPTFSYFPNLSVYKSLSIVYLHPS